MQDVGDGATVDALLRTLRANWPDLKPTEALGGGFRNVVVRATLGGKAVVARRSRRDGAALDWELRLMISLRAAGVIVPMPIPAIDGRLGVDGVSVVSWIDGDPPATTDDWQAVAAELRRVHATTRGWPQRPGFASTRDLLVVDHGGDVDLRRMPADAISRCRAAWRGIIEEEHRVVHGDPGAQNIRISRHGAGFIDWDEARVDASILDFAAPPLFDLVLPEPERRRAAVRAATAWETANGWMIEPDYARRMLERLAELDR